MFGCAIAWVPWPETTGKPCHGIARYRRPPRGRLLRAENLAKFGAVVRRLEAGSPLRVAAVWLILLTGRRSGKIRRLRWCDGEVDRLTPRSTKTEPRHVLLGEAARALLDDLADTASGEWVFLGENGDEPLTDGALYWFWTKARDAAGIVADAWLHDRHKHASHAVMNGEILHVPGRLLGHRRASTTNRYADFDDTTLSEAAERVAGVSGRKLRVAFSSPTVSLPGLMDTTPMRRNPGMVE